MLYTYRIYQLDSEEDGVDKLLFRNSDYLVKNKLNVDLSRYISVYSGQIDEESGITSVLDDIYYIFNNDHPEGFRGHSLSVSDVICLESLYRWFYVDSFGFKEFNFTTGEFEEERSTSEAYQKLLDKAEDYLANKSIDLNEMKSMDSSSSLVWEAEKELKAQQRLLDLFYEWAEELTE